MLSYFIGFFTLFLFLIGLGHIISISGQFSNENFTDSTFIPTTISSQVQEKLKNLKMNPAMTNPPEPEDKAAWKQFNDQRESLLVENTKPVIEKFQPNVTHSKIENVSVIDIKPNGWVDNGKILVYTHGGGFTQLSANSTLAQAVLVANATGLRTISIDYIQAPFSKWNQTTDDVVTVIRDLKDKQGFSMNDIGVFGDSAGTTIMMGSILKMRDADMGTPAVIVLLSPIADLTLEGETFVTLEETDPILVSSSLDNFVNAYANATDQKNPYVSPIFANFSKGFPPTLIQVGTKEILLSDSVRLYQALDQANIPVKLDVYEGMSHVFQFYMYPSPESDLAITKMNNFLKEYLVK